MKKLLGIMLLAIVAWSCENVKEYKDPTDNIPPGQVTSVKVENLHGGAMITYTLPADNDLLGVKAVYTLREDGQEYEIYSSAHRDTVILAGFPDTNERTVNLYAIDLSRNLSESTPVTIKPLTPPVELVRQSLKVNETFSGIYCAWENMLEEDIAVSLYVDSIGELTLDDTYFSNASKSSWAFRGYENKPYTFRVEIRDRWLNYAIPLDTVLTPMYERQIPGRSELGVQLWYLWGYDSRECISRGDNYTTTGTNRVFSVVFDNILFDGANWWHLGDDHFLRHFIPGWTGDAYPSPAYMSIDMGREANYSRFKIYMRARSPLFSAPIFTGFELWGTNNPKPVIQEQTDEDRLTNLRYWTGWEEINGTDEWKNDWVKLGDYNLALPSGATLTTSVITAEDDAFIRNGFGYDIDLDKTSIPCRYLRFVLKKYNTGDKRPMTQMGELQFFGSLPN